MWPAAELADSELGLETELEQLEEGRRKTSKSTVAVLERENTKQPEIKPHLGDHLWWGRTWIQSSVEPAGQQEGSSDQFLEEANVPIYTVHNKMQLIGL